MLGVELDEGSDSMVINTLLTEPLPFTTPSRIPKKSRRLRAKIRRDGALQSPVAQNRTRFCVSEGTLSSSHDSAPENVMKLARNIRRQIVELFPGEVVNSRAISKLMWDAYRADDENYGEGEAMRWAANFTFEAGLGDRDASLLDAAGGDLSLMVRRKYDLMSSIGRLSEARVRKMVPPV